MVKKTHTVRILWLITAGFLAIIALLWLDELTSLPRLFGGIENSYNWRATLVETLIVMLVAIPLIIQARRMINRLYYLEGFMRMCSWCKRVEHDGEWMAMEVYIKRNFQTETSHGICQDCLNDARAELDKKPVH
jgi:hypothetical protein